MEEQSAAAPTAAAATAAAAAAPMGGQGEIHGQRRASLAEEEQLPPPMISVDVAGVLVQFVKTFVIIFPVYALGYLGLSFSWVLIGLVVFFWWQRNRGNKRSRLYRALSFLEHEHKPVQGDISSTDLPAWVRMTDRLLFLSPLPPPPLVSVATELNTKQIRANHSLLHQECFHVELYSQSVVRWSR